MELYESLHTFVDIQCLLTDYKYSPSTTVKISTLLIIFKAYVGMVTLFYFGFLLRCVFFLVLMSS